MIAESVRNTPMGRLMRLMSLGGAPYELEAVCRTSDGFYLGQVAGDLGYNAFLGSPKHVDQAAPETRALRLADWEGYSLAEQAGVRLLCAFPPDGSPIPLAHFLPCPAVPA